MPFPITIINNIRDNVRRSFDVVPGILDAQYYVLSSKTTNVYHDESAEVYDDPIDFRVFIEFDPPMKVIKELGWWKEHDTIPLLAYLPYFEDGEITPKKGDKFTCLSPDEGFMEGEYRVNHVKSFGEDTVAVWLLNVSPKRDFGATISP